MIELSSEMAAAMGLGDCKVTFTERTFLQASQIYLVATEMPPLLVENDYKFNLRGKFYTSRCITLDDTKKLISHMRKWGHDADIEVEISSGIYMADLPGITHLVEDINPDDDFTGLFTDSLNMGFRKLLVGFTDDGHIMCKIRGYNITKLGEAVR